MLNQHFARNRQIQNLMDFNSAMQLCYNVHASTVEGKSAGWEERHVSRKNGRRIRGAVCLLLFSSLVIGLAFLSHPHNKHKEARRDPLPDESLEPLYAQLEVPAPSDSWMLAIYTMAAKSSKMGEEARSQTVGVIKHFIERKEPRDALEIRQAKGKALVVLGELGGPEVCALLRSALTEEGARELTKAWLNKPMVEDQRLEFDRAWTLVDIRGRAAVALVYSGNEDDLNMVRTEYERLAKQRVDDSRYHKPYHEIASTLTPSEKQRDALFLYFVDALARRDLFKDKGRGAVGGDAAISLANMEPYIEKYNVPKHEP